MKCYQESNKMPCVIAVSIHLLKVDRHRSITIIKVYKSVVHGDYYIIQVIYSDGNNKISVYSHIFRLDIEVYHKPSLMMARVNSAVCANTLCNIFTTL